MTTGNIIPLPSNNHRQTLELLPWYVTGAIEPADRIKVDVHLAECPLCRAELETECALRVAIANLPFDADAECAEFSRPFEIVPPLARFREQRAAPSSVRPRWMAWVAAAQAAALLAVVSAYPLVRKPVAYRTLGAASNHAPGNIAIIFGPKTSERTMRRLLASSGVRLVDGPSEMGVYVLAAPPNRRDVVLAQLRSQSDVILAQPIDADDPS